jgi:hypothetical protein
MIHRIFEQITGRVEVAQDRLSIEDDDTEATLYINQQYRDAPLSSDETHVVMKLSTENGETQIGLDGEQLDGVVDTLYNIQQDYQDSQEVIE